MHALSVSRAAIAKKTAQLVLVQWEIKDGLLAFADCGWVTVYRQVIDMVD